MPDHWEFFNIEKTSLYKLASGKLSIIQLVYSSLDIVHNLWASRTSTQLKNLVGVWHLSRQKIISCLF